MGNQLDAKDQVAIIEKQIERLHAEVMERIRSFSALWRTAILGVAGVLAFRSVPDLDFVVLLASPLFALALAYWVNENASLLTVARAIADEERKLNEIAHANLLTYESWRHSSRSSRFVFRRAGIVLGAIVVVTGAYLWVSYQLYSSRGETRFGDGSLAALGYKVLVGICGFSVLLNGTRLFLLTRENHPRQPTKASSPQSPASQVNT